MQRQGVIHKKAFYSLDDLDGKADFSLIVTVLSSIRIARTASHKWFGLFVAAVVLPPHRELLAQGRHLSAVAGIITL